MTVEIDGQMIAKITNAMGWLDDDLAGIKEVAFCVTDFGRSNEHISQLILTLDRNFKRIWSYEFYKSHIKYLQI